MDMKKTVNKKIVKSVKTVKPVAAPVVVEEKLIHTWGKWVERPRRTETLVCECGNRYIKTRKNQKECVQCMVRHSHEGETN
jgi:hypothetical protein